MRRCLAETGSARKVETETNITFGKVVVALGEAEWAAIQTRARCRFGSTRMLMRSECYC